MSGAYDGVVSDTGGDGVTFRVMAPFEQARFTRDAWGYLLRLRAADVLTGPDFEQVVERALSQVDGRIGIDELRALLGGGGEPAGDVTIH